MATYLQEHLKKAFNGAVGAMTRKNLIEDGVTVGLTCAVLAIFGASVTLPTILGLTVGFVGYTAGKGAYQAVKNSMTIGG